MPVRIPSFFTLKHHYKTTGGMFRNNAVGHHAFFMSLCTLLSIFGGMS